MIEISQMAGAEDLQALREIFLLSSSRQSFDSAEEKERFFFRWTGYYLECLPKSVWLTKDAQGKLLGYLMGCRDSSAALPFFSENNKSYALFDDLFERFPAHFHINCHPAASTRRMDLASR